MKLKDKLKNSGLATSSTPKYGTAADNAKQTEKWIADARSPKDFNDALRIVNTMPTELADSRQKFYKDRKSELDKQLAEAKKLYEKNSENAGWAEVGELIGQSLVQLAAANRGLKTGVDLSSGLKFKPSNWDAKQQQIANRLDAAIREVGQESSALDSERSKEQARFDSDRRAIRDRFFQKVFEDIRAKRQLDKESRKEKKEAAGKEDKTDSIADKNIKRAQENIAKFDTSKQEIASKLTGLKQQLSDGDIDEEKFNNNLNKLAADAVKKLGVSNEEIQEAIKKSKDKTWWGNDIAAKFGWSEKIEEPQDIAKWLESIETPEIDEDIIRAIREASDPKTPLERKEKIRSALRSLRIVY